MESKQDLAEAIAKVAYEIYQQRGASSSAVENWLEAEQIILKQLPIRTSAKMAKELVPPRTKNVTAKKNRPGVGARTLA
jgi:hypothetical protein